MIITNSTTSSMATAAIATISLNKVLIISKYQVVKKIGDVVINYPSHYRCKVLVAHDIIRI